MLRLPRQVLVAVPVAAAAAVIAGCVAGASGGCRQPPKVDCSNWQQPTARFWRINDDEEAAARAVVGVRTCSDLVGQPLRVAYERYGRPFPIGGTGLNPDARIRSWGWQTGTGMYLAYDRSKERRIEQVVLFADNATSSDTGWNYCGEPWKTLARYEGP